MVDREACEAACTRELHAAAKACRLAAEGLPFRDAYRQVAQDLQDGTFAAEGAAPVPLGLARTAQGLEGSRAWLRDRRAFLATTYEQLFAWGTP